VPSVFFYISGHGFGHASREIEVINVLGPRIPGFEIVVRSSVPRWLFDRTIRCPFTLVAGPCDTGVVQIDSLRLDAVETIRRAAEFHEDLPGIVAREAALLRAHDAAFVVADAPPAACAAAAAAGVRSAVLTNFTWDWIYEGYPEALASAPGLLPAIRDAYRLATEAWRMPLYGGFETFAHPIDVPFIARHAAHGRSHVRRRLGLPLDSPLALFSFSGYGVQGFDPRRLDCLEQWGVVMTGRTRPAAPPHGLAFVEEGSIYDAGLRYEDLVAAVDVVVTKPGFGLVAECLANSTAMLYTSRGRFAEYDVMVAEMPRFLRCEFLNVEALVAGRWRDALNRLMQRPPPPEHPRTDGADVVADMICERIGGASPKT
jgi:L-arabinokinase